MILAPLQTMAFASGAGSVIGRTESQPQPQARVQSGLRLLALLLQAALLPSALHRMPAVLLLSCTFVHAVPPA